MKKRAIITYLLAFALLLSACVYVPQGEGTSSPSTQGTESTPSSSDTSPSTGEVLDNPPGEFSIVSVGTDEYCVGACSYREISMIINDEEISGMALYSCDENVEELIIPEEVNGQPVVAIGISPFGDSSVPFRSNEKIKRVVIPETVCFIGGKSFSGSCNLIDLTLPSGIKWIGQFAFRRCPGLKEIQITPEMKLNHFSFYGAVGLEKVVIEEGVTFIPSFTGCSSLSEINIPSTVTMLTTDSSDAYDPHFYGTQITFVEIPEGVTHIEHSFFQHSKIESVIIPSTLKEIGEFSFDTDSLMYIYFRGTAEQCAQTLLDALTAQTDATIYYLSETEPTEEGNFWHYVDGKPVIW